MAAIDFVNVLNEFWITETNSVLGFLSDWFWNGYTEFFWVVSLMFTLTFFFFFYLTPLSWLTRNRVGCIGFACTLAEAWRCASNSCCATTILKYHEKKNLNKFDVHQLKNYPNTTDVSNTFCQGDSWTYIWNFNKMFEFHPISVKFCLYVL